MLLSLFNAPFLSLIIVWTTLSESEAFKSSREHGNRLEEDGNEWKATLEHIAVEYRHYQSQTFGPTALFTSTERQDQLKAMEQVLHVMRSDESSDIIKREALTQLARRYFYGTNDTYSDYNPSTGMHDINGTLALQLYAQAATLGDPEAQFHVGVAYSYGYWGFSRDEAKSLIYLHFAAKGNDIGALMTLAHKYDFGINVKKSCETAAFYYEKAASHAMQLRKNRNVLKPRVYDIRHRRIRQYVETKHKKNSPSDEAVVDYYRFSSEKGDADAALNVAYLYYYGIRGVEQNVEKAAQYFHRAQELGAEAAAFHLGHIYARGIGVEVDVKKAIEYLELAEKNDHAGAKNELSILYMEGSLVEKDHKRAAEYLKSAAKQGSIDAFFNLGVLQLKWKDIAPNVKRGSRDLNFDLAHAFFQVAALQGHTPSRHKVGLMHYYGIGTRSSCSRAVESFKHVAERGDWDQIMWQAYSDFKKQAYEASFLKYVVMAMQGLEAAQDNAAYILDRGYLSQSVVSYFTDSKVRSILGSYPKKSSDSEVALRLYKLAALQKNVDANLVIGDYYYYGKGGIVKDVAQAIAYYRSASHKSNAQAAFNLGYMHEHGIGLDRNLTLATLYFERAMTLHKDARIPVRLALFRVQTKQYFQDILESWSAWAFNEKEAELADDASNSKQNAGENGWKRKNLTREFIFTAILAMILTLILFFRALRRPRNPV